MDAFAAEMNAAAAAVAVASADVPRLSLPPLPETMLLSSPQSLVDPLRSSQAPPSSRSVAAPRARVGVDRSNGTCGKSVSPESRSRMDRRDADWYVRHFPPCQPLFFSPSFLFPGRPSFFSVGPLDRFCSSLWDTTLTLSFVILLLGLAGPRCVCLIGESTSQPRSPTCGVAAVAGIRTGGGLSTGSRRASTRPTRRPCGILTSRLGRTPSRHSTPSARRARRGRGW
jgi:hypothetical protein